jgi:hypothetical protein
MNTETIKIKKAARSILRVDPSDLSRSEFSKLKSSARRVIDMLESVDDAEFCEEMLDMLSNLKEVVRG